MRHLIALLFAASGFAQPGLKLERTIDAHPGVVGTVAWRSDGRLVSAGPDGVKLWDGDNGSALSKRKGSGYGVAAVEGETIVAAGETGGFILPDKPLAGIKVEIRDFAFAGSRLLASAGENRIVYVSDPKTGALVKQLAGHRGIVTAVAFSPSGKQLVSGSFDNTLRVWDVESGKLIKTVPTASSSSLAFSPDGKILISGHTNGYIRLWDSATWTQLAALKAGQEWVRSVSISPDGAWIASAAGTQGSWTTGLIEIWNLAQRKVAASTAVEEAPQCVAFHPKGTSIASAHGLGFGTTEQSGRVRLWTFSH